MASSSFCPQTLSPSSPKSPPWSPWRPSDYPGPLLPLWFPLPGQALFLWPRASPPLLQVSAPVALPEALVQC